jgi:hypothetical protein
MSIDLNLVICHEIGYESGIKEEIKEKDAQRRWKEFQQHKEHWKKGLIIESTENLDAKIASDGSKVYSLNFLSGAFHLVHSS